MNARLARAYETLADRNADHRGALTEVAALYLEGVAIDWPGLHGPGVPPRVPLPSYPFQRERCWIDIAEATAPAPATSGRHYRLEWAALPAKSVAIDGAVDRRWVIVPGDEPLGAAVHALLVARGAASSMRAASAAFDAGATDILFIAPASGVSDAAGTCGELLTLVQRAAAAAAAPRISVVTRAAFPIGGRMTAGGAAHAPLAAFSRVVGLEHPELGGRVIDLDAAALPGDAQAVIAGVLDEDGEDQIAIRDGVRYGQRIERVADGAAVPAPLRPDAAYLITGGLGQIGLIVAGDFARRGARLLCLAGRSGISTPAQHAAIAAIEAHGARVRIVEADVADRAAMQRVLRDLAREAPLAGVVHAAGMPGYAGIAELTPAGVASVMRPKVEGAWTLHELTRDLPLDFFVCFSSIASAWGSRGQAHYAAGNAFLDALAHLRRAEGLPAVTINWGPWAGGGMTSPEAAALLRRVGIAPLPDAGALDALAALASGGQPQAVVADIDWALFRGSYEARGHRRLLERIDAASGGAAADVAGNELTRAVLAAAPGRREALLADIIQREVAAVLDLPAASRADLSQGLFEMGMDSLMALELRTRLQTLVSRALPATLVFDYPTIQAIAHFIAGEIAGHAAAPAATPVVPGKNHDALSDAEAEALLLKKLESIH